MIVRADRRFRTDGRHARVMHVPLTDAEWRALHEYAHRHETTKGELASRALRESLPITPKERQK